MDSVCKHCLEFQYVEHKFRCKVDGKPRSVKDECSLEQKFQPHPVKDRDFEKEIAHAEEGKSGIYEGVQGEKLRVYENEPRESHDPVQKEEGDTPEPTVKKVDKKKVVLLDLGCSLVTMLKKKAEKKPAKKKKTTKKKK